MVLGAAGGVGLAAVELATAHGAPRCSPAASSAEKLALCLERGAVATINYATEDLKARIKEITGRGRRGHRPRGRPDAEAALRAMAWGGRFVTVGFADGEIPRSRSTWCCSREW